MRFGVITFTGSNCDHDCYWALRKIFSQEVEFVWHKEESIDGFDCLILPGGFSWGDYLSVCPNLSFPHAVSGNPLLISGRFRLKDCRNYKKYGCFRTDTTCALGP